MKAIRQKVGHDLVIQCGASVIVLNSNNEMLLQLRKDNHCWSYAGGAIEPNEVVEEAAKRELFEETGLVADKLELYGVFSGPDCHYIYPNGDEVSNIDIVYVCKDYSGHLKCQVSEVLELHFFPLDQLPENLSPPVAKVIHRFVNKYMNGEIK